ncbi:MAG: cellulase family glycosylhydrolase [Chloroflexota bacterium]|nr:cellulase family glycosylhydrolase [Chloroflexota bacterium]
MQTFRQVWDAVVAFFPKNLVPIVVLLAILLVGCTGRPDITKAPVFPADPRPTSTPHVVHLPGVGSGGTSPLPTATPFPSSLAPTEPPPSGPTPLPPPVPKPSYGVQVHLFAGDMAETLHWAQGLGVGWVKQQVTWHTIEHGPDDFDWELLDRAVEACNAFGFKLLLGVVHAPDWTRVSELETGPPADYAEFGRFMGQLATRYRGRVEAYELWNEPNLAREWQGDTLDPTRFVALVAEGARGVRAADPDALVISGAPAVTGINDGVVAIDDRVFLRGMYEAGIAQWVDGIGLHPYGFANPPDESWQDSEHVASSHHNHPSFFFRDTLEEAHAIMLEYGDTEHQIWVTEFGWPSTEGMGRMDTTGWEYEREVSEDQQADYIVRAFQMGEERPWVGPMFLWNVNLATIWGSADPVSAYSLLRPDSAYRPAYIALRLAEPLNP